MKRQFRLTTREYMNELRRAALDDQRWPNLRRHQWLIDHATVKDGEITIVIDDNHATVAPARDLRG